MYQNVGKKIKILASAVPTIIAIVGIFATIAGFQNNSELGMALFLICLVVFVCAFVASWPLYGFGQLVEDTQAIREKLDSSPINHTSQNEPVSSTRPVFSDEHPNHTANRPLRDGEWKCPCCGRINAGYVSSCACGKNRREL